MICSGVAGRSVLERLGLLTVVGWGVGASPGGPQQMLLQPAINAVASSCGSCPSGLHCLSANHPHAFARRFSGKQCSEMLLLWNAIPTSTAWLPSLGNGAPLWPDLGGGSPESLGREFAPGSSTSMSAWCLPSPAWPRKFFGFAE